MSLPVKPNHTISVGGGIHVTIDAIQVGEVTAVVPPGSVIFTGTVIVLVTIIILISSGEWSTAVHA